MSVLTVKAQGIVTLLSPLSHGGDTDGTIRSLRREKFRQPDGRYEYVPVYSGNGFRGQLRDCGVLYMLGRLGWDADALSPAAFYFLFSGGALSKDPGQGIDIDRARRLQQLIPIAGLLGGAVGRQILRGKLQMGRMVPLCLETSSATPELYQALATNTVYDALQVLEYTRTDDVRNAHLSNYMQSEARRALEGPRVKITHGGDEIAAGGAQQMRYGEETLATGTLMHHEWSLEHALPMEIKAFLSCLQVWSVLSTIGGNARIGHGKVAIGYDDIVVLEPGHYSAAPEPRDELEIATGTSLVLSRRWEPARVRRHPPPITGLTEYDVHLENHGDEISELLGTIR